MLNEGDVAPDFAVGATTLYKILDERSAVVFFYPKAFTPGCAREAAGFCSDYEKYRGAGAEVIGVSADTAETNQRFRDSLGLPYPLASDPDGSVLRAYKVRWPVIGLARRVTYVIGRDRKIRSAFESQFDVAAHLAQACEAVTRG
jgi:thioredoxin-dependent peroxiredoxin